MTWTEISIVSVAAAVLVLIAFTVRLFITATRTLHLLGDTIVEVKQQAVQTTEQAENLIKQIGQFTEEVHLQLLALEPSIQSVEKAGAAVGEVASTLRKATRMVNESMLGAEKVIHTHQKRIYDAMEWATTGFELWQRWKAHRNAK
ncbi:hypothetical protein A8709_29040 [Paenibacillus pectinilyticus]|uniref:DUF948 domain-containing protein n=1 Tax=Paenibacillus pectinilyticus TaxID=512399 RepID=A0A1C0ZUX7_9BACL|nr:DUF948 domain-containing protein [Paenibacillus pectinilyticus]OCT11911.1 hypothetical protein A8709_29040 [Paenibacillus pectinilyticus]